MSLANVDCSEFDRLLQRSVRKLLVLLFKKGVEPSQVDDVVVLEVTGLAVHALSYKFLYLTTESWILA